MRSRLCQRHFRGNGAYDGAWRYDSQRLDATKEALSILNEWIEGGEQLEEYRDAIYALLEIHGEGVKEGCKRLWVASLPQVTDDQDMCLSYFDEGMDLIHRYFRRCKEIIVTTV